ncbi:MAG: phospholipase C, phosphocholine-specific, partial [Bacteroidota bacterium]|nr:phospholipase C, phosphocholine-specific [Bacteroidota bacterium]
MDTRREFLKKASLVSGALGVSSLIPAAIQRAMAIEANEGTTWKDAEHVVILMQENRSFDHCYGTLRGVRGFNDPRAIQLPNQHLVWLQTDKAGRTYTPFRLDMKDSKATWMSSLPHSWKNQVNARNDGKYDQWLIEKQNSIKEYAEMPLTLGYHTREDIPFYYALADGFTVCDQHFCSALTGTNPNRLYFWSGTIRAEQDENSRAHVWNDDMDYGTLHWKTFPERLEENGISWKFYQNELSIDVGFEGEQDPWLSNFQDNPLEFFSQYNVRLHAKHLDHLRKLMDSLPGEISLLQKKLDTFLSSDPSWAEIQKSIQEKKEKLDGATKEWGEYNHEKFSNLSLKNKTLHQKAFVTNLNDPDYHSLEQISYDDKGTNRVLNLPKGDILHQFREDVKSGNLPAVSWLASPENLSDHPSSAWYGAWYVSEVMDILTHNPEIWKKTIFILTYDENDGYFDHVPPFVAPHSDKKETGAVSPGMDTRVEFVTLKQEEERRGFPQPYSRESPIGLGFRVPMVIASPWTKGGYVNSEVFDHTSTLQFLETFLSHKSGKIIHEPNISDWRRTVCGDLTSAFRPSGDHVMQNLDYINRQPFVESVYNAKFKKLPSDFKALSIEEINLFQKDPYASPYMPVQEKGIRLSCGLNYELYAEGILNAEKNSFDIRFEAGSKVFGRSSLGSAFSVYAPGKYRQDGKEENIFTDLRTWAFAVKASDQLVASWPLKEFENEIYFLRVYGPNGFFREYKGTSREPGIRLECHYQRSAAAKTKATGNIDLVLTNLSKLPHKIEVTDNAYKAPVVQKTLVESRA